MTLMLIMLSLLVSSPLWAATRFAIPSGGATTGACLTEPTACTRDRAISQAVPGDTITLADGTYSGSTSITCGGAGGNATNGTAGGRITLKATTERQAFLQGSGASPLQMTNCSFWTVEGLHLANADNQATATTSPGAPINIVSSHNNIFRRLLVHNNNRWTNSHGLETYLSNNNLIEENEVYNFHRHGIIIQTGNGNTIRRNYVNSRGFSDLPGCNNLGNGSGPWCSNNGTRGDNGIQVYPGSNNLIENNISEWNQFGLDVIARFGAATGNKFYGNIALDNQYGLSLTAGCDSPSGQDMPQNSIFEHNVAINTGARILTNRGFRLRSNKNTQTNHNTFIGPVAEGAWQVDLDAGCPGDGAPTTYSQNTLLTSPSSVSANGIAITGQADWSMSYLNVFNYTSNTPSLGDSHLSQVTTTNPQLGTCYAWVPDGSPMKGAGSGGSDMGATVLYRYQDGSLTTTPLWDQNSGKFPCGAAVTGVNDIAGSSCFDVHQRLHINTGGCAFPAGYGTVTPPPTPIGNFALYTFDENSGTAAVDTSGQGHTLTLSSAGWGAPIIGVASLVTDGSRSASVPLAAGMAPDTTIGLVGWWNGTTPATCDMISLANSAGLRLNSNGTVSGFFFNGSNWPMTNSSPVNVFDGQSHMVWMTKSPTELRVGVDTAQLGSSAVTGTITYTLGSNLVIGKHGNGAGSYTCPTGRIDQVRLFDTELTPTAILNLYNEQVPTAGLSVTHMGWFAPNAPEGVAVGAIDTNLNQLITLPVGVRWSIHKADAGTLTEYFRPFCRVLSSLGALVLDWTEITNSFGSTGIRFYADSVVTTGATTSARLPTDGFTTAPGVYLDNPVDISSPYDAPQRMTLSQAGHGELEMKIEFGSPRVAGERIECRPQRENGAPFTTYMGSLP